MHIGNIPCIATGCVAGQSSILNRLGHASQAVVETMQKVMTYAKNYFMRVSLMVNIGLHVAWSATKNFANDAAVSIRAAASAVFAFAKTIGQHTVEISQKVGSFAANYFAKAVHFAAVAWTHVRAGAVQGFQMSRTFFATHQKETIIAGCGVAVGMAAYYAASRLYAAHHQAAQTQTI
jgi:hypothetical protein